MNIFEMVIIGADWAGQAIRNAIPGVTRGILQLVEDCGVITDYALGKIPNRGPLEVVEEIEVAENDLDDAVLDALREHGAVRESLDA